MGLNDSYEHGIARGVVRYARTRPSWRLYGYGWMFRPLEALESWEGDGVIARVESAADARSLAALGLPVVDVAGAYIWSGFHQVTNDDLATGRQAAAYLRTCGFTRFAFCGVRGVAWSEKRRLGFAGELGASAAVLPVFERSLPWWESPESSEGLEEWVARLERPVGVFSCNDTAGLKVSEICRRLSVSVPEEAAILGVDNEDILCELSLPTLSSIALDLDSIGYHAAELLDRLLTNRERGRPRRGATSRKVVSTGVSPVEVSPKETVERESTQVFTCSDPLVEQAVRYIRTHAHEPIRVGHIVAALPASRRSLEVRFRRAMGRSVHDELVRLRLERARKLLRSTDARVTDVALECGFGTSQRFHAAFRAAQGCSPARYRRDNRARG